MEFTKDSVLTELNNMKSALENSLTEKANAAEKNVEAKLDAVNSAISELKSAQPEVTAAEVSSLKSKLDATVAGLEILASRKSSTKKAASKHLGEAIVNAMSENEKSIVSVSKKDATTIQLKDVGDMTIANNLTGAIPNTYRDGVVPVPFEMIHARSVFSVTPSATDSYHFYRHAIGEGGLAFQTNENTAKSQFDEDLVEETVNLNYLAGFLRVSRKMLKNFTALRSYLGRWLPEKYYNAEDALVYAAIKDDATGTPNTTGTDWLQRIILTIGAQKQAKYNVNAIIVGGNTWAEMLTYKNTSEEYVIPMGSVSIAPSGQMLICGVPVYTASWIDADEALVCDTRYMEIVQSEGLSLQFFEQDADNVTKNKITARIEASVGFALLDPAAFCIVEKYIAD